MPEKFSSKKKSAEQASDPNEIDGIELVCKDGIVMRKDSTKTRFSTAIYFIESRRVSIDIIDDTGSIISVQPASNDDDNDSGSENTAMVSTAAAAAAATAATATAAVTTATVSNFSTNVADTGNDSRLTDQANG